MACPRRSRSIATRASWAARAAGTSLACLGVEVVVCPPHRPDRNAFVERYHRTYEHECLQVHRPATLERAREVTTTFAQHYNHERPNQALSCGNRPPCVAFPVLPARPALPERVDPDRWLRLLDRRRFVRKVQPNGIVLLEHDRYYVGRRLSGQYVVVSVEAATRTLVVQHQQRVIKRVPLKGRQQDPLDFEAYLAMMRQEARIRRRRVRRTGARAA
jgi:integrase-like protein